ncbi:T9SS type A sorting domain-containing protein [uncultured Flavobacterium sp.]|uniref:T9SS type A sorting domain-containing protein n=1 Tax=uncultured Flavobacterium sp. TaxID=165435 RepID=UPI0030C87110
MKKILLFLFFTIHISSFSQGQDTWNALGASDNNQASNGTTLISSTLFANKNNHFFVLNKETAEYPNTTQKISLKKFDGTEWSNIQTQIFTSTPNYSLAVDNSEMPFLFYNDPAIDKAVLKKFNGTNWIDFGGVSISDYKSDSNKIIIGEDNSIYVTYRELLFNTPNNWYYVIKKFNGTTWITLNSTSDVPSNSTNFNFALDNNNTPHISYYNANLNESYVKTFNGTIWQNIGASIQGTVYSINFDNNNIPFVFTYNRIFNLSNNSWNLVYNFYSGPSNQAIVRSITFNDSNELYAHIGFASVTTIGKIYKVLNGTSTFLQDFENVSYNRMKFINGSLYLFWGGTLNTYVPYITKINGNNWELLGEKSSISYPETPISSPSNNFHDLTYSNSSPYISYQNIISVNGNKKLNVKKHNGAIWEFVGPENISELEVKNSKIEADQNGNIYVGYISNVSTTSTSNYKISVKKFDGTNWQAVGPLNFSIYTETKFDLKIDQNGVPYVIYAAGIVQKFNGTNWEFVGTGIPGINTSSYDFEINFDNNNVLYGTYYANSKINVSQFNGTDWIQIDGTSLNPYTNTKNHKIVFDSNNTLYLGFIDNNNKVHIKTYNGSSWIYVGSEIMNSNNVVDFDFQINNNIPYVAFSNQIDGFRYRASIYKFENNSWQFVGQPEVSPGAVTDLKLIFGNNNTPVISYNASNGVFSKFFGTSNPLTVTSIDNQNQENFILFPNPVENNLNITYTNNTNDIIEIVIYNSLGQKMNLSTKSFKNTTNIPFQEFSSGIYFISILQNGKQIIFKKIIKK